MLLVFEGLWPTIENIISHHAPPHGLRVEGVPGQDSAVAARGADDGAGEAAHLAGVRAPRAAAAEEPRVRDLLPTAEVALGHDVVTHDTLRVELQTKVREDFRIMEKVKSTY